MTRTARVGLLIAVAAIGGVMVLAHRSATVLHKFRSEDPVVWEGAIAAFEHADRKSPPPLGAASVQAASASPTSKSAISRTREETVLIIP